MSPRILDFCMVLEPMASCGTHRSTTVPVCTSLRGTSVLTYVYRGVHRVVTPTPSVVLGVLFGVESSGDVRICDMSL